MQILHPIPDPALAPAAALWRRHFGVLGWPRRIRPDHGIAALSPEGRVVGVLGLRDAAGGLPERDPPWPGWLFSPAPETGDLVIDGVAVCAPRRGIGCALVQEALRLARGANSPGLRAEVREDRTGALAFYDRMGFVRQATGRYGPPWWGRVHVLHLPCAAP